MKTENNDVIKDCIKFITDFLVKNDFYFVSENTLVNEKCSVEILKKEGYGENILSVGGDGDEGIVDIDTRGAKINFDKLK